MDRETQLFEYFKIIRPRMEGQYAAAFNRAGADVGDAMAKAFAFAVSGPLGRTCEVSQEELEDVLAFKLHLLWKDAIRMSYKTHGRRSVRTEAILDAVGADGKPVSQVLSRASVARSGAAVDSRGVEKYFAIKVRAIEQLLRENGVTERDYKIFDKIFYCRGNRAALANELGIKISNLNRVYSVTKAKMEILAEPIRERYLKLVKEACK